MHSISVQVDDSCLNEIALPKSVPEKLYPLKILQVILAAEGEAVYLQVMHLPKVLLNDFTKKKKKRSVQ